MDRTRWSRALLLAPCALLALSACRGPAPREAASPTALPEGAWFCETSSSGGWACRPNADPTTLPQPTRQPVAGTPEPLPSAAADPAERPGVNGAASPSGSAAPIARPPVAEPPPAPVAPAIPAPQQADDATPLYRRLAYPVDGETPLTELPAEFYVLQLLALSTAEELAQYTAERQLHGMTSVRVERNGDIYHVLVAGVYEDGEAAERAALNLEAELEGLEPWVRPLRTLQDAMRRADQLAGE